MSAASGESTATAFDVAIIGGGINGCGIARDAVGRGYSVCLFEAGDLGGGTSAASTKLIHGGLRYLEHYEFRLVRESLMEREVLWSMAPHIIRPMRFVLPHHEGMRPAWLLRLGLFLYDHIGGRRLLPATKTLDLRSDEAGEPLKPGFTKGFEYSDCWVEDSRLVVLNACDAAARGAAIRARTRVVAARRTDNGWTLVAEDTRTGQREEFFASILINAAGPWVDEVLREVLGQNDAANVRLVRGSHIVIRRKYRHQRCYMFQNADERVIFAIPYEDDYTLIGTTDAEHDRVTGTPTISADETAYLCRMASEYFREPVTEDDIVWTYSGVRPLFDDGASKAQEATRDYVIKLEGARATGALLNIFGGKITTYRRLSELVMEHVESVLGARGPSWTRGAVLPGGDFEVDEFDELVQRCAERHPFIEPPTVRRLVHLYGTRCDRLLDGVRSLADLGQDFGNGLYEREVDYLQRYEYAFTADDILFRRTKLGIRMTGDQIRALQEWIEGDRDSSAARSSRAGADSGA